MSRLLLVFTLSFCLFNIQSGDVMMYLAIARDFILTGQWGQTDLFGYLYPATDGVLHWHHEYLSILMFYAAWALGGYAALVLLKTALIAMMSWVVLRKSEARPEWAGIWMLAVWAASFRFIERASLISDLFAVLTLALLLTETKLTPRLLTRLVIVFFLWIQFHPGFAVGFVFVGIWALWHRIWSLKLLLIPAAMLLNPDLQEGLLYPFRFALTEAQTLKRHNYEWLPAYHSAFIFSKEMIAFWALAFFAAYFLIKARDRRAAAFALTSFVIACATVRFVPMAAFAIALCAKPHVRFSRRNKWVTGFAVVLLLTLTTRNFVWGYASSAGPRVPGFALDPSVFPTKTLDALAKLPRSRFYNSHDFGAYLIWRGIKPVFHHGFVTDMNFYESEVIGALNSPAQFFTEVNKYGWTTLLVDKHAAYRQIHAILAPHPEWRIIAEDEAAYLILRTQP